MKPFKASEPTVVITADLKIILDEYIKREEKKRPFGRTDGFKNAVTPFYGIKQYLSDQSGISVHTISVIMQEKTKHTSLRVADALLSAIGRPDLLSTDIRVVPNPQWTQEKWLAWKASCESE